MPGLAVLQHAEVQERVEPLRHHPDIPPDLQQAAIVVVLHPVDEFLPFA
jgi:hypothetical protein